MKKEHPEYFCNDCGHPNVTWYAPNELWNRLCEKYEIICPKCFQQRADKKGINLLFIPQVLDRTDCLSGNYKSPDRPAFFFGLKIGMVIGLVIASVIWLLILIL